MQKIIKCSLVIFFLIAAGSFLQSCKKQGIYEPLVLKETQPIVGSEEYYANLRAYKKSDHAIAFGWFGGSSPGGFSADIATRYTGLPDSMDIVSLWGGFPKDSATWEELRFCQEVKGTKFVNCMFGSGVDNLRKKNFPDMEIMQSIDSVAKSIADTLYKYNLDGFDLDYEPNYGDKSIFGDQNSDGSITNDPHTQRLFIALSKYMGPKSGTNKILMIDGQFDIGIEPYIDYLAQQAYGSKTFTQLQNRFTRFGGGVLPSKKFIVTENMQKYGAKGTTFNYNGINIGSVLGMATWNPAQGRKGGFGAYIMETDARSNLSQGLYYYYRKGIQIQNPAAY